jgi:hypothetical protein
LTEVLNGFLGTTGEVSTILATQNGVLNVSARQGVDIGAVVDPSYLQGTALVDGYKMQADAQNYSASSVLIRWGFLPDALDCIRRRSESQRQVEEPPA